MVQCVIVPTVVFVCRLNRFVDRSNKEKKILENKSFPFSRLTNSMDEVQLHMETENVGGNHTMTCSTTKYHLYHKGITFNLTSVSFSCSRSLLRFSVVEHSILLHSQNIHHRSLSLSLSRFSLSLIHSFTLGISIRLFDRSVNSIDVHLERP